MFEESSAGHLPHMLVHKKKCNRLIVAFQLLQFLKRFPRGSQTNDAIPVPVPVLEVFNHELERLPVIVHNKHYRFGHNILPADQFLTINTEQGASFTMCSELVPKSVSSSNVIPLAPSTMRSQRRSRALFKISTNPRPVVTSLVNRTL